MNDFPPIGDELKPRRKLVKHADGLASDEEVDTNARVLSARWGASTAVQTSEPSPTPIAPVVSIRGYIPTYLDDELTRKAAERRVTKTFLLMEALAKTGYRVDEADLVQDRRKRQRRV